MKLIITILLSLFLLGCAESSYAGTMPMDDIKGVHAVLGEARGESYQTQLAIAHAIRNRGSFKGVYGLRANLSNVDGKTYQTASKAWNMALETPDPTSGATHWLSDWDLKHAKPRLTAFRFKMIETAYYGTTHFYKERA